MKRWLFDHLKTHIEVNRLNANQTVLPGTAIKASAKILAKEVLKKIGFPTHKPPAHLTIDDRAFRFVGTWPSLEEVANTQPWYRFKEKLNK